MLLLSGGFAGGGGREVFGGFYRFGKGAYHRTTFDPFNQDSAAPQVVSFHFIFLFYFLVKYSAFEAVTFRERTWPLMAV